MSFRTLFICQPEGRLFRSHCPLRELSNTYKYLDDWCECFDETYPFVYRTCVFPSRSESEALPFRCYSCPLMKKCRKMKKQTNCTLDWKKEKRSLACCSGKFGKRTLRASAEIQSLWTEKQRFSFALGSGNKRLIGASLHIRGRCFFFVPQAALIRLIDGGAFSSKYGSPCRFFNGT